MKKYFTSALVLGVLFSLSTVSALSLAIPTTFQTTSVVVDTVAEQVDCTALRYPLSLGSKDSRTGGDVTNLQVYLSQTGYLETDPTGYFGNATKKAVQAFQRANGIAPQGNVGPYTRAKIKELSCNGPIAQQPVPTTPTNPVMCTMEMVQCPDGSYSGRSGPNCETNCSTKNFPTASSSTPTIGFLSTPTLRLRYDSTNRESTLYGQATIRITAGNTPVETNGIVSMLRFFNNGALAPYSNGTVPSLLSSSLGSGTVIPANTSATFTIAIQAPTKEIFAGSYTVGSVLHTVTNLYTPISNPIIITGETPRTVVEVSSYPPVAVIGETSPYISSITCDSTPNINCGITGSRFDPVSNTVTIGGITRQIKSTSYSWTSSTYISFQMTEFGITQPGTYVAQVTTREGASNTFSFTSTGVNQPTNRVITVFGNKDPNPTTGATTIIWNTSKPVNASLDMVCTPGSISFTTNRGNNPICEKGGIWNALGQNSDSIIITPSGNTTPITVPFTLTVSDINGVTLDKETISITFPATKITGTPKNISPVSAELIGNKATYSPGEKISFSLKGIDSTGAIASPAQGLHVQSNMYEISSMGNKSPVIINGVYQSVNSVYNYTTKTWDITMTAPSDTTKNYTVSSVLYCSNSSLGCTSANPSVNGYDGMGQINKPFDFKIASTPISVSASLLSSSPVSQLVVGNSTFLIANYNLSVQGSAGILRSLTLTTTGADAIESVTVNGITAPVIMNKAVLSGLSSAISAGGLNLSVIVKFAGIMNSTTGGILTSGVPNVGVTLASAEITPSAVVSGVILNTTGSVVVTPLNVPSNKMILVASKPTVTMSAGGLNNLVLGSENKIGEFTVMADPNGSTRVGVVTLNVASSNIQNLQISSFRVSDSVTTITSSAISMFGNSITVGFNNNLYQIPPGRPVTFAVYGVVSGTPLSASVPMYLTTSLAPSGFNWTDIVGGNMAYNGTNVYNFPTNSYSITGMGTAPTPVITPVPVSSTLTPADVALHSTPANCWIIIGGNVYSVSSYISMHPGGSMAITSQCGKDATVAYHSTHAHSPAAGGILKMYLIGTTTPVVANPIPAPTISIGATPASVISGQSATVSWSTTNVNYCTVTTGSIDDYGAGAAPFSGSKVVGPLTSPRTITITCPGKNGTTATQSVTIPVTAPVVTIPAPTATISTGSASVTSGQSTTVSWTATNVNYCTVTSGSINDYGPGSAPLVGSLVVGPLTSPRTVTITCPGKNGTTATQSVTIPVIAPTVVPVPAGGTNKSTFKMNVLGAFASNVSCTDIPRNLIRGSESSYVTLLQDFLYNNGFLNESSTGFYGDKTVEAVKDYQATRGLPTTGMVYDFTRQAIYTDTCQ